MSRAEQTQIFIELDEWQQKLLSRSELRFLRFPLNYLIRVPRIGERIGYIGSNRTPLQSATVLDIAYQKLGDRAGLFGLDGFDFMCAEVGVDSPPYTEIWNKRFPKYPYETLPETIVLKMDERLVI